MKRFLIYLVVALGAAAPALWLRLSGEAVAPVAASLIFGVAILSAGFMLSWGAEAAEERVTQGLMIAGLALVTVIPEYAVDIYLAYRAGQMPGSDYVHYAAANMTGANRLLVGFGWSFVVLLHWLHSGKTGVQLREENKVELLFLALPTAWAFVIIVKDNIALIDFIVLIGMFAAYIWRVSRLSGSKQAGSTPDLGNAHDDDDDDAEPGPAAALERLSVRAQWAWTAGLTAIAVTVIFACAEPFAEAVLGSAEHLGVDRFLLIQWVAPLTGETPELILAVLFVLAAKPGTALLALISDKINQWTLLVGALPIAMSVGAGTLMSLPLSPRQHEEFFLTAAQSAFALTLLLDRRLSLIGAALLLSLFCLQIVVAFTLQGNSVREIAALTTLSWVYLGLALACLCLRFGRSQRSVA